MSDWEQIRKEIIGELKPTDEEEAQLLGFADKTITQINKVLEEAGIDALAEFHGSVAHGTWISGQQDLDIFLVNEKYVRREQLQIALDAVRAGTGWVFTEAYAEHPYLQTKRNGYSLDIVPCFRVEEGEGLHSSTDRTPLHTRWLDARLRGMGDEVRLLKRFLMTLDLYGAEIKIGGFSGYLCELLVVYYNGFLGFIEAASRWGKKTVISFSEEEPRRFNDALTVIDPVDSLRNVASALREDSYGLFTAAARSFKREPSMRFFRREVIDVSSEMVLADLRGRPSDILFLVVEEGKADVPDVIWGQIHKSRQALERQLVQQGFNVLRSTAWSNEETRHIFIYELESGVIPETVKHMGPPASLENNVRQFIDRYRGNPRTVSGPDLLEDRWYVLVKRDYTDIRELMKALLANGGSDIGVSKKLTVRILQHHRVLLNEEIGGYLVDGFEVFLFDWLKGRPQWIE
ncbi:CCA tRNA nucleotidyltransferase [Candidatus Bathyarchaeota archaeon]|nr:MAG: CCA tRNA nucleotidyltransferase [Candidatus Bathyarchaeota archaeon]